MRKPTRLEIRRQVWERDNGICGICGQSVDFGPKMHADHIVPRALGGSDALDNLRATHSKCNQGQNRGAYQAFDYFRGSGDNRKDIRVEPKAAKIAAAFKETTGLPPAERRAILEQMWSDA